MGLDSCFLAVEFTVTLAIFAEGVGQIPGKGEMLR